MTHHKRAALVVAGLAVAALSLTAPQVSRANEPHWLVAAGVGARPDYEGSDTMEAFPTGTLKVWWDSGRYINMTGAHSSGAAARFKANLLDSKSFELLELGPVVQYRPERDDVDSGPVEALGKVDGALELGGFATLNLEPIKLSVTGARDVSDSHDGGIIELAADHVLKASDTLEITSGLASTWASDDYMQTYFGVTPAGSVASGLPTFGADEGFKDIGLRFTAIWAGPGSGWEHLRLMGLFSWFKMLGDAEDSPVVDDEGDDSQFFGGFAVGWQS